MIFAATVVLLAVSAAHFPATEATPAEAQWHLQAPARGCVEFSHTVGGSQFRTYACDGANGACIFRPNGVDTCPFNLVAFQEAAVKRIINIRGLDHLFEYHVSFGQACVFTPLQDCCVVSKLAGEQQDEEECHVQYYGDRKIDDPYGCSEDQPSDMGQQSEKARFQHMLSEILQKLATAN